MLILWIRPNQTGWGRTSFGYRGGSSVTGSDRCYGGGTFNHTAVFTGVRSLRIENVEYPLSPPLGPFNLLFIIPCVWRVHSPPESPLNFAYKPGGACCSRQTGPELINIPLQICKCHPRGFAETARTFPLDRSPQRHAHIETVFGQLFRIIVSDHPVLVGPRMRVRGETQNERTHPKQC